MKFKLSAKSYRYLTLTRLSIIANCFSSCRVEVPRQPISYLSADRPDPGFPATIHYLHFPPDPIFENLYHRKSGVNAMCHSFLLSILHVVVDFGLCHRRQIESSLSSHLFILDFVPQLVQLLSFDTRGKVLLLRSLTVHSLASSHSKTPEVRFQSFSPPMQDFLHPSPAAPIILPKPPTCNSCTPQITSTTTKKS